MAVQGAVASRSGLRSALPLLLAGLSVADGGDLPAAFGHGVLLLHDRTAAVGEAVGVHAGQLRGLLLARPLSDAAACLAAPRPRGDAVVRRHRLSRGLRAGQGAEGAQPRGDLPARHPAVLVERAGAHLLLGDGAARGRHPRHRAQRSAAVQDQHRPDVFLSGRHHRAGALLRALHGADLLPDAAGDRRLADRGRALARRLAAAGAEAGDHPAVDARAGRGRGTDLRAGRRLVHGAAHPRRPHRHLLRHGDRGPVRRRVQLAAGRGAVLHPAGRRAGHPGGRFAGAAGGLR